jgi:hypothetical protein
MLTLATCASAIKSAVNTRAPVGLAPGAKAQLQVHAVDEDGLAIRRGDRTLDFIVSKNPESGEGIKRVVANYVPAQSAYCAEVVLPQAAGEYQLRLDKVFGFGLLERNGSAAASLASPIILVVADPLSATQKAVTIALAVAFVLCFGGLLVYIRKNTTQLKALFFSLLSNEGVQGFQIVNETVDFASGAFLYHTVLADFTHFHALFISFTVSFALACFVSSVSLVLKIRALVTQLRMRKRDFALLKDDKTGIDRKTILANRLARNRKDRMTT